MRLPRTDFVCEPDPENPGWHCWRSRRSRPGSTRRCLGKLLVRAEAPGHLPPAHVPRILPHTNLPGTVHGAMHRSALIDIALFASLCMLREGDAAGSVTLDVHSQFIGAGELARPLDAVSRNAARNPPARLPARPSRSGRRSGRRLHRHHPQADCSA